MKNPLLHLLRLPLFALLALPLAGQKLSPTDLDRLVGPYLATQQALAGDDLAATRLGGMKLFGELTDLAGDGADARLDTLRQAAKTIGEAKDLATARDAFKPFSDTFTALIREIGTSGEVPLFVAHCPMAFGYSGGDWIQGDSDVLNPYFGASMLRCGGIREQLAGDAKGAR
jgi:hypothetical protein